MRPRLFRSHETTRTTTVTRSPILSEPTSTTFVQSVYALGT
jgi:hypothetical protein